MSLITACPACQTQFEVTDEQLEAYAGKVRCGECNHVFDARAHLFVQAVEAAEKDAVIAVAESETDHQTLSHASSDDLSKAEPQEYSLDFSSETSEIGVSENTLATSSTITESPLAPQSEIAEEAQNPQPKQALEAAETFTLSAPEENGEDEIPAFLRNVSLHDERPLHEMPPSRKRMLTLSMVVLTLLLAFQAVYFSRTAIAASYPQMRPILQAMCQPLHCTVPLPKDLSQLTIDDADLQEHIARQGALVFSSVLINHGTQPQALPHIEITLTNTADEPVIRKRIAPQQYLAAGGNAEAGIAPLQELHLKFLLGVKEKAVAGYRLALAY